MAETYVERARQALPGEQAALLVHAVATRRQETLEARWVAIHALTERLKRRAEKNGFADGIREVVLREHGIR